MATWDRLNSHAANNTADSASIANTFGFTATAGNLLVLTAGVDKNDVVNPTGWNVAQKQGFALGGRAQGYAIYWKISDGTETAQTVTWTTAAVGGSLIQEFEIPAGFVPVLDVVATGAGNAGATSTSSGTTAATADNSGLAVAAFVLESTGAGAMSGWSYTNSFTGHVLYHFNDAGAGVGGGSSVYKVLTDVGTQETTISFTGAGINPAGGIATFRLVVTPAITWRVIGSAANVTTSTSTVVTTTAAAPAVTGARIIVRFATDNAGTGGAKPTYGVVDSASNTYAEGLSYVFDPGLINAGIAGAVYSAPVTATLASGGTVTVSHSPTTPAKAIVVEYWTGLHAVLPNLTGSIAGAAGTAPSCVNPPNRRGQLVYVNLVTEGPAGDVFTGDSDTLEGVWYPLIEKATADATATNNVCTRGQYKIVTGIALQTWAATITSRDYAGGGVVFNLVDPVPANASPLPQLIAR